MPLTIRRGGATVAGQVVLVAWPPDSAARNQRRATGENRRQKDTQGRSRVLTTGREALRYWLSPYGGEVRQVKRRSAGVDADDGEFGLKLLPRLQQRHPRRRRQSGQSGEEGGGRQCRWARRQA